MSKTYTITISDAQDKAMSVVALSTQEWIENAVKTRANIAINEISMQEIERKLAAGETITGTKEDIVLAAVVETAFEKNQRIEQELTLRG